MIVITKENIDSLKYGIILKDTELEVEDSVGETWIKQGVAYGKVKVDNTREGNSEAKREVKTGKPKSNT